MGGPISRVKRPYTTGARFNLDPGVYSIQAAFGLSDLYFVNTDTPHAPVYVNAAVAIRDEQGSPVQGLVALNFRVWRILDSDISYGVLQPVPVHTLSAQKVDPSADTTVDVRGMYRLRFGYEPGLPLSSSASARENSFAQHLFV